MTVSLRLPLKQRTLVGLLRRLMRPRANKGPSHRALSGKRGDIRHWRGYLHRGEETLRRLDLSSVGAIEDEVDAELCLVKGEVLHRAGHDHDAQRFLRQAPHLSPTRRSAAAMALRAAAQDLGFQRIIEEADRARDNGEWGQAGELYDDALHAYPDHYGYVVQYAHCLKEQGQFAEAECHYRSALALGAPRSDVDEHLIFVATKLGFPANFTGDRDGTPASGDPLDAPPTKADVELIILLLLGREPLLGEILQLLRAHRSLRSLTMAIVDEGSFISANARLMSTAGHRRGADRKPG